MGYAGRGNDGILVNTHESILSSPALCRGVGGVCSADCCAVAAAVAVCRHGVRDERRVVEVAFGCDANGNGTLDDSEASFALGWDCGEWFFRDIAADVADSYAGSCGRKKLDWNLSLDQSLAPKTLRVNAGVAALPFIMAATMYDPSWNVARVTTRGFGNAEAVLKFGATKEPLVIRIR